MTIKHGMKAETVKETIHTKTKVELGWQKTDKNKAAQNISEEREDSSKK